MRTQDNTNRSTDWRELAREIYEGMPEWQEQDVDDDEEEIEEYFDCE